MAGFRVHLSLSQLPKLLKHSLVVTAQSELASVQLVWTMGWDTGLLPKCNLRVEIPHMRTKYSHSFVMAVRDQIDRMSQTCSKC